jgi:hypothetical protein
MTKDEDDWLSDFLEAAQAAAKQNQTAAEKDYASKLRLLTPRFTRASGCDSDKELAKRLAASEALAGQKKFDAASDALDEAYVLAAGLLSAAAAAMAEAAAAEEIADEPDVSPAAAEVVEDPDAGLDDAFAEFAEVDESAPAEEEAAPPTAPEETPAETPPDDLEASFNDVFADLASVDEPAAADEPEAGEAASGEDSAAEEKS